jgi:hypothetical protein
MARRVAALFCWAYLVWVLLTWTLSLENELLGAGIALAVAVALAPLGAVAGPWRLLTPRAAPRPALPSPGSGLGEAPSGAPARSSSRTIGIRAISPLLHVVPPDYGSPIRGRSHNAGILWRLAPVPAGG